LGAGGRGHLSRPSGAVGPTRDHVERARSARACIRLHRRALGCAGSYKPWHPDGCQNRHWGEPPKGPHAEPLREEVAFRCRERRTISRLGFVVASDTVSASSFVVGSAISARAFSRLSTRAASASSCCDSSLRLSSSAERNSIIVCFRSAIAWFVASRGACGGSTFASRAVKEESFSARIKTNAPAAANTTTTTNHGCIRSNSVACLGTILEFAAFASLLPLP